MGILKIYFRGYATQHPAPLQDPERSVRAQACRCLPRLKEMGKEVLEGKILREASPPGYKSAIITKIVKICLDRPFEGSVWKGRT